MKAKRGVIITVGIFIVLLLVYLGGVGYYSTRFLPQTYINGQEMGSRTLEDSAEELTKQYREQPVIFTEGGVAVHEIPLGQLVEDNYPEEIRGELTDIYQSQAPHLWFINLVKPSKYILRTQPELGFGDVNDEGLPTVNNDDRQPTYNAYIDYTNEGYVVVPETVGEQVSHNTLKQEVVKAVTNNSEGGIHVAMEGAYIPADITEHSEVITNKMDNINQALQTQITLNLPNGVQETITPKQIEEWMYFNEHNQIVYDINQITGWLNTLNEQYADYGQPVNFNSTLQGQVTVPAGTMGWAIDVDEEANYIYNQLVNQNHSSEAPYIIGNGPVNIGNSYIEVDLANQKLFVYVNGVQEVATDIVSGMAYANPPTPTIPGAYYIWGKESPSVLVGRNQQLQTDYEQPVQYWLPFDFIGQGIHDANWQPSFGGTAFHYAGSQGCINTPPGIMPLVYELAYVGMPVFVY